MRVSHDTLLLNGPEDWSVTWYSPAIWLGHIVNYAIQLQWTGSPTGMLKLQASSDPGNPNAQSYVQQRSSVTLWTDIEGSEQLVNMDGNHMWKINDAGYIWVRAVWMPSGGTATLVSARFSAKGV